MGIRIEQQVQNYHLIHDHCCLNNSLNEHHQKRIFFLSPDEIFVNLKSFCYRITSFRLVKASVLEFNEQVLRHLILLLYRICEIAVKA